MPRTGGHRGEGERLPILPSCLQDGPASLPPRSPKVTNVPSPITDGEHVSGHLLAIPPQVSIAREEPTPAISCLATPVAPAPSSGTKWQHHSPNQAACSSWPTDEIAEASEEPPCQKWKDWTPLKKFLKGGQQEAFSKDSDLVQHVWWKGYSKVH